MYSENKFHEPSGSQESKKIHEEIEWIDGMRGHGTGIEYLVKRSDGTNETRAWLTRKQLSSPELLNQFNSKKNRLRRNEARQKRRKEAKVEAAVAEAAKRGENIKRYFQPAASQQQAAAAAAASVGSTSSKLSSSQPMRLSHHLLQLSDENERNLKAGQSQNTTRGNKKPQIKVPNVSKQNIEQLASQLLPSEPIKKEETVRRKIDMSPGKYHTTIKWLVGDHQGKLQPSVAEIQQQQQQQDEAQAEPQSQYFAAQSSQYSAPRTPSIATPEEARLLSPQVPATPPIITPEEARLVSLRVPATPPSQNSPEVPTSASQATSLAMSVPSSQSASQSMPSQWNRQAEGESNNGSANAEGQGSEGGGSYCDICRGTSSDPLLRAVCGHLGMCNQCAVTQFLKLLQPTCVLCNAYATYLLNLFDFGRVLSEQVMAVLMTSLINMPAASSSNRRDVNTNATENYGQQQPQKRQKEAHCKQRRQRQQQQHQASPQGSPPAGSSAKSSPILQPNSSQVRNYYSAYDS